MPQLLKGQKLSTKSSSKAVRRSKKIIPTTEVEFRWSDSVFQSNLAKRVPSVNVNALDLTQSPKKPILSSPYLTRK